MTDTNHTDSANTMEIVRLGNEAMANDFGALAEFADFSMAMAKAAHLHEEDCLAMALALDAVNAYRRFIGLEAHESQIVTENGERGPMTDTNYIDIDAAATMEIARLGEEAMAKNIDTLTDDDFDTLVDFADLSMAEAKAAHRDGEDCAAMTFALDAVNAYRRVIGLEAHESEIVIEDGRGQTPHENQRT